jgi:hypothetical protein
VVLDIQLSAIGQGDWLVRSRICLVSVVASVKILPDVSGALVGRLSSIMLFVGVEWFNSLALTRRVHT